MMKSKLAVFDFDSTIKEYKASNDNWNLGIAHHFPSGVLPDEVFQAKTQSFGLMQKVALEKLAECQAEPKDILKGLATHQGLVSGIDQVVHKLSQDHEMIIISGSHLMSVEAFLKHYHLDGCFMEYFGQPSGITEQGQVFVEDFPQEWKNKDCEHCGHDDFCKTLPLRLFLNGKNFEEIKYFGDGKNDLCPIVKVLGDQDQAYPRKNKRLEKIILEKGVQLGIKAKTQYWTDGQDLIDMI